MKIVEIKVKKILGESKITDYTINPYIGCQHSCFYCYSKHYTRKFLKEKEEWGKFVYVKVNAAKILEKEIRKKKKGSVYLSSLTDPYQPIEKKYKITREILDVLAKNNWKVIIQTKSSLVLRDLDILKKFEEIEVGFTITTLNENLRKIIEPFSSSIKERINALKKLKKENIRTFLFVGPLIFPFVNFEEIRKLIEFGLKSFDEVFVDKFRVKNDLMKEWKGFIAKSFGREKERIWESLVKSNGFWKNVRLNLKKEFGKEIILLF